MSAPKFTAGPLKSEMQGACKDWPSVVDSRGMLRARTYGTNAEEDSKLYAAAPDLYAALTAIVAHYHGNDHGGECQECGESPCDVECILREGFAALAKAEGGGS